MPESTSVICPVCQRTCGSGTGLSSHMRSMHRAEWERENEAAMERATPSRGARPAVPPPLPPPPANGIRWEEPPASRVGKTAKVLAEVRALVIELKRNPGKWARIKDYASASGAGSIRTKLVAAFPDVEFVARKLDDGSAIWARFVEEA